VPRSFGQWWRGRSLNDPIDEVEKDGGVDFLGVEVGAILGAKGVGVEEEVVIHQRKLARR
jgi:hypothetical protein